MNCRRYWWALALAALGAACLAGLLSRPARPFTQAVPLLPSGTITNAYIESGYDFRRRFSLAWFVTPDHAIASFQRTPKGTLQLLQFRTERTNPPAILEPTAFAHLDGQPLVFWAQSPDGKSLLTVRRLGPARLYQVYNSDHTLHASWTNLYEARSQPDWLNNSQGFVEWPIRESRLLARICWLDSRQSVEIDLDALPVSILRSPGNLPQPCIAMLSSSSSSEIAAEFLILAPARQPDLWKRVILPLPEPLSRFDRTTVALSPAAHRLAWLCDSTDRLPRLTLDRLPPFIRFEPQTCTSLFVSLPDGSGLTFLGRTPSGTTIAAVRWSPASDYLTFLYDQTLWRQALAPPP